MLVYRKSNKNSLKARYNRSCIANLSLAKKKAEFSQKNTNATGAATDGKDKDNPHFKKW